MERPRVPAQACPVCGAAVDPLRAERVVWLEREGAFHFDGPECADAFRAARAAHVAERRSTPTEPPSRRSAVPPAPIALEPEPEPAPAEGVWPAVGLTLAAVGALLGAMAAVPGLGVASAAASLGAAGVALQLGRLGAADGRRWGSLPGPAGVTLAAVGALIAGPAGAPSWPLVGVGVAALATVGRAWLDLRARQPVDRAASALVAALPGRVRVPLRDAANPFDVDVGERDTSEVRVGEEVLAFEGETLGVDGVVAGGQAAVYLHPGARTPTPRRLGDPVLAGARVVEGSLRVRATRAGDERALVRPRAFGRSETTDAAPMARLARRLTTWGGLAAIGAASGGLALGGASGAAAALSAAAAVLLGAPFVGLRRGAELPLVGGAAAAGARGIVFLDPSVLERAGRASVCALGTRGQLTEGEPRVVDVLPVAGGADAADLLALAAGLEAGAGDHPIARAVLRFADHRGVSPRPARRVVPVPGRGVTGVGPGGEPLVIGNRQLLLKAGVSVAVADAEAAPLETGGQTVLFLGVDGHVRGLLVLSDAARPGARAAVQRLFDLGVEVVLLSGDHRATVETLARELDLQNVRAELSPDERGEEVRRLRGAGGTVAAVGLPTIDDAALASADVPIVLDGAGGPLEHAVALATRDLRDAAASLWIARAARVASRRAVYGSLAAGLLVVLAAATGVVGPGVASVLGLAVDASTVSLGARLLRRIDLRVPARA